jgi:hypothetical protein
MSSGLFIRAMPAKYRTALSEPDVRFEAHYGLNSDIAPCPKSANTGSRAASFDYFVGRGHQRNRNGEAEGPGGLQIDDQLESRGLFDGQIGGICAFQYLVDVTNGLVEIIGDLGASAS